VNVTLPLKVARRLLADVEENSERGPASDDLRKAIARAEALLVPRPWGRWGFGIGREWPRHDTIAACVTAEGWCAYPRDPRYDMTTHRCVPMASGPETGELGQRKADEALAAYCKRQGVKLPASWFLP
jgi:hypothetical protein